MGQEVTITATVSPAAPTGTVSFTSNGMAISGCTAVPLTSLTAVCTTSTLALGTDAIVATYSGDSNYTGSSGTLSQIVNPVPRGAVCGADAVPRRGHAQCQRHFRRAGYSGTFLPQLPALAERQPVRHSRQRRGVFAQCHGGARASLGLSDHLAGRRRPAGGLDHELAGRAHQSQRRDRSRGNAIGSVSVYVTDTTNVMLDIDGYFTPSTGSTLEFYPLTPCRVVDTRSQRRPGRSVSRTGSNAISRCWSSTCGIPNSAASLFVQLHRSPHEPSVWDT